MAVHRIEILENEQTVLPAGLLEELAGVPADVLGERLEGFVNLRLSLKGAEIELRAGVKVGSIQVGGVRVDVRPRLASAELATLIRYALGGVIDALERSHVGAEWIGLDELLCVIFAEELTRIRQVGLSRNYVNRRQALPVLRGRPDFLGSFPYNDDGMSSFVCRFHELTCDNLDNQLILAGLERACLMGISVGTRRNLLEHWQAWASLASPTAASGGTEFAKARGKYTRLSDHYRLAHNLAEIILQGRSPAAVYETGVQPTKGLFVDMPALFDRFVERLLRTATRRQGLRIESQQSDRWGFTDAEGASYRRFRPDLVVYDHETPIAVVDAKYKDYWEGAPTSGAPTQPISNEDLYQMFFYTQRLQLRHHLPSPPLAVIVSPAPAEDERHGRLLIGERYRRVFWSAGADPEVGLSVLLLPMTRILRALRGLRVPANRKYVSAVASRLVEHCSAPERAQLA